MKININKQFYFHSAKTKSKPKLSKLFSGSSKGASSLIKQIPPNIYTFESLYERCWGIHENLKHLKKQFINLDKELKNYEDLLFQSFKNFAIDEFEVLIHLRNSSSESDKTYSSGEKTYRTLLNSLIESVDELRQEMKTNFFPEREFNF